MHISKDNRIISLGALPARKNRVDESCISLSKMVKVEVGALFLCALKQRGF